MAVEARKEFENLRRRFAQAGKNKSQIEALIEPVNALLYDAPKGKDADLHAEIEGLLHEIRQKITSVMPEVKEEEKAASPTVASATAAQRLFPEGFAQVDTPDDHNCLFWAATLGLLLPILENDTAFNNMYDRLFGVGALPVGDHEEQDGALLLIEAPDTKQAVRNILRTYDCRRNTPLEYEGNILQTLVCAVFRGRVVNALSESFPDTASRAPILVAAQLDDPRIASWEAYLNKMRESTAWGGTLRSVLLAI
jgi:hypothetical protein